MALFRRFSKDRKGATAVEFALVSPLLFATALGAFEVGRALYERNRLGGAAAMVSREISINNAISEADIKTVVQNRMSGIDKTKLRVNVTQETISNAVFKKIEIAYDFETLINFKYFGNVTVKATRYAPMARTEATSTTDTSTTSRK